jgi:hypothetical protein
MKTFAVCTVCGFVAFVAVQYHMTGSVLGFHIGDGGAPPPPPPAAKLKFPEALACVCRRVPVREAAPFTKNGDAHPAVVLRPNGTLHKWTERLQPGWQAESVEETQLVIVLTPQQRSLLQIVTYPNGAPPIKRFQYDMDARVLEAKTGRLVGFKHFQTVARPVRPQEIWQLTELGDPVTWHDVNVWLKQVTGFTSEN